jgi:hypothetical protein
LLVNPCFLHAGMRRLTIALRRRRLRRYVDSGRFNRLNRNI